MSEAAPRVLIAAGGTAGHVVPALAVADALRAEGAHVEFAGGDRAERELVPAAGYDFHRLDAMGIDRASAARAARAALVAARGLVQARSLIRALRPDAVMGAGGYMAGIVGTAAALARVPLVLTEADSHLGLSNRVLAPLARSVCLAFEIDGRAGDRYRVTGRPVPAPPTVAPAATRRALGVEEDEPFVLVFGGSLGARSINTAAVEGLRGGGFHVLHVCGARDYPQLASGDLGEGYDLREYMDIARFTEALAACDLVVGRAGGSVFEIAACGRPAVLIPYPHATADHQSANAAWMVRGGAAVVIDDAELSPARLAREVGALLSDRGRLASMAHAAAALARPHAAREIAAAVIEAARLR